MDNAIFWKGLQKIKIRSLVSAGDEPSPPRFMERGFLGRAHACLTVRRSSRTVWPPDAIGWDSLRVVDLRGGSIILAQRRLAGIQILLMGSLKKRRKAKINKHKRRKKLRAHRHKKRTWQK